MAVAFDAQTASAVFTTTTPFTFSHTPAGTPRGVFVMIHSTGVGGNEDSINGTVSYGGVTMTRVQYAQDTATEFVAAWIYFLGSGIPTGTRTVSISHTGITSEKKAICLTVTAGGDTDVVASAKIQANQANPSTVLANGADTGLAVAVFASGLNALSSITLPTTGMTSITTYDVSNTCATFDRQTTPATGNFTAGYTAATDDVAFAAASVRETPTGSAILGAAALAADGTIAATGREQYSIKAALAGDGTLTAAGREQYSIRAALAADGTLAGIGTVSAGGADVLGIAALAADGTLAASGRAVFIGIAALAADGTLAATGREQYAIRAALSADGTLAATPRAAFVGAAAIAGDGSLTALGTVTATGAILGQAALAADGSLSATARMVWNVAAALSADGSLNALARMNWVDSAALSASATVTAAGTVVTIGIPDYPLPSAIVSPLTPRALVN